MPLPLGLAAVRERDDDVEALAEQAVELVLGLGEPARGERRPLRVERERLALRQRVELGRAVERQLGEPLLGPDRAHLVGLPDEVGRRGRAAARGRPGAGAGGVRPRRRRASSSTSSPRRSAAGVDRRAVELAQRALRERRERADALDLVAEELDAQRLAAGRREDVDEPAANGELAALLDALDALVAGERELLGEQRRSRARRRARSRSAPAAPSGGGIGSASASADEQTSPPRASTSSARARSPTRCGGGSRPGAPAHAARREERDVVLAEEPRRPPRRGRARRRRRAAARTSGRPSSS